LCPKQRTAKHSKEQVYSSAASCYIATFQNLLHRHPGSSLLTHFEKITGTWDEYGCDVKNMQDAIHNLSGESQMLLLLLLKQ